MRRLFFAALAVLTSFSPAVAQQIVSPVRTVTCSNQFLRVLAGSGQWTCAAVGLTTDVSGILPVANGGTGLASGTSGGVLAYTASGTLASSGALTVDLPVIGGGAGAVPGVGTRSGNTTAYVTTTGSQTSGRCVEIDASGNHIAAAAACGAGSATVSSVGLSVPASSIFGTSGTPVTTSGTLGLTVTGTSGGVPYFDTTSTLSTSGALTANRLVLGGGAGAAPTVLGSLGTTTTVLHGNAGGAPTFGAVANADLTNSSITLNAGSNTGLTAPGAMSLGSTYTIGATSDTPRFAGLGLGGTAAGANSLKIYGSSSGSIILAVPAAAGSNTLTLPAGTTDLSGTGGTSQVLKQTSSGGAITVARLACSDLSDSGTGCAGTTGGAKFAGIGWVAASNPDKSIVFTAGAAATITDIRGTVETAVGAAATISLFKTASGTACSGGTNLIDSAGTFNANGTANTNQSLTLAGSGAPSLSAGDRVCLSTSNGANFSAGAGIGGITITYTVP